MMINVNFFLIALTVVVSLAYLVLLNSYQELKRKRRDYERQALARAQKIIDKAMVEASSILSKAQVLEGEIRAKIAESSQSISENQKDVYSRVLEEVKNQLSLVVQKASDDIKRDATEEISAFASSIRDETISTEKEVREKISQEYLKLENELAEYKRQRLAQAQVEIERIITQVTSKVLGRSLTREDHKELIIIALDEARREGVL